MTRFMGLDLHKNYIHGYVFQPGQKGTHFRFSNTPDEWARFLATRLTPETAVAIEATGNAFTMDDRLVCHALQVVVIHPAGLKGLGAGRHHIFWPWQFTSMGVSVSSPSSRCPQFRLTSIRPLSGAFVPAGSDLFRHLGFHELLEKPFERFSEKIDIIDADLA